MARFCRVAREPNGWGDRRRRRVGLLGGSFNPAHAGHRHISLLALRALALDEVWWLVSPQNPLKPRLGMAPFSRRLARAQLTARHPAIRVTGIEAQLGTQFTADTVHRLVGRFPATRFVWLMGADNLQQMPEWDRWITIFHRVGVAVFDRSPYSYKALAGKVARRLAGARIHGRQSVRLAALRPPRWCFIHSPCHPASATIIRQQSNDYGRW
ncbi:MAG TPA: nicotinate-nucleotide adenylyltransferase [Rhodospirillaceae bacterium]|nr:nicotinate-nucleotide adenylyltransferase [Rhodospirillaceae bacterium]